MNSRFLKATALFIVSSILGITFMFTMAKVYFGIALANIYAKLSQDINVEGLSLDFKQGWFSSLLTIKMPLKVQNKDAGDFETQFIIIHGPIELNTYKFSLTDVTSILSTFVYKFKVVPVTLNEFTNNFLHSNKEDILNITGKLNYNFNLDGLIEMKAQNFNFADQEIIFGGLLGNFNYNFLANKFVSAAKLQPTEYKAKNILLSIPKQQSEFSFWQDNNSAWQVKQNIKSEQITIVLSNSDNNEAINLNLAGGEYNFNFVYQHGFAEINQTYNFPEQKIFFINNEKQKDNSLSKSFIFNEYLPFTINKGEYSFSAKGVPLRKKSKDQLTLESIINDKIEFKISLNLQSPDGELNFITKADSDTNYQLDLFAFNSAYAELNINKNFLLKMSNLFLFANDDKITNLYSLSNSQLQEELSRLNSKSQYLLKEAVAKNLFNLSLNGKQILLEGNASGKLFSINKLPVKNYMLLLMEIIKADPTQQKANCRQVVEYYAMKIIYHMPECKKED